jgi:cytochrome c oxidase subunit 2
MFDARSPEARAIADLFTQTLVVCAVIGVVVTGLVVYCIVRFRAVPGASEPSQVEGHTRLEIAWTALPFAIVVGLFALTARAMQASDPPRGDTDAADLTITAHQWWWEARYKGGAVAANEIHVPAGRQLLVRIESADVIHDFWVPQLARKIDAVPGHPVHVWMQADAPGTYSGACAEYCGAEHAWMRIVVVAEPETEFLAWQARQLLPAPTPSEEGAIARGSKVYDAKPCAKCHAIGGRGEQPRIGPDLTHIASRATLGAGVIGNSPADLTHWLRDPQGVKPGSHMPDMQLTEAEVDDLVAYFETMR